MLAFQKVATGSIFFQDNSVFFLYFILESKSKSFWQMVREYNKITQVHLRNCNSVVRYR